jgi:hypothetical protein
VAIGRVRQFNFLEEIGSGWIGSGSGQFTDTLFQIFDSFRLDCRSFDFGSGRVRSGSDRIRFKFEQISRIGLDFATSKNYRYLALLMFGKIIYKYNDCRNIFSEGKKMHKSAKKRFLKVILGSIKLSTCSCSY